MLTRLPFRLACTPNLDIRCGGGRRVIELLRGSTKGDELMMSTARFVSAEGHGVASLDSPGATHLSIHADVNFVVACRCAQDPAVLGEISLRKCGHDAARAVVGDREHDVVADPKFSPHPLLSTNSASSFSGRTTMLGRKRLTSKWPCG